MNGHSELPAIGGGIEPLQIEDVDTVVDMHRQAFKGKLSGELSKAYFRAFFRDLVGSTHGVCYGWKRNGELVGAVCGTVEIRTFWTTRARLRLAKHMIITVIRKPAMAFEILRSVPLYLNMARIRIRSYMLAFVVREDCRGTGIGTKLMAHLFDSLGRRGCDSVFLWSDSDEPAAKYYVKQGFKLMKTVKFLGKKEDLLYYDLRRGADARNQKQ